MGVAPKQSQAEEGWKAVPHERRNTNTLTAWQGHLPMTQLGLGWLRAEARAPLALAHQDSALAGIAHQLLIALEPAG